MDKIKQADIDFFRRKLYLKKILEEDCQKMQRLVGDYTDSISQALDLTNESIQLTLEKIGDNKYIFRRVVPRKLKFKSIDDIKDFLEITNYNEVLIECSGKPVALPGTKITSLNINTYDISSEAVPYKILSLLALSIVGIIPSAVLLYDRWIITRKNNKGFDIILEGSFEIDTETGDVPPAAGDACL